jgi:hypothetical protein
MIWDLITASSHSPRDLPCAVHFVQNFSVSSSADSGSIDLGGW